MKTYLGTRHGRRGQPIVVYLDAHREGHELPVCTDKMLFSRTFDWGSDTAGATQLAFAILFDHYGHNFTKTKLWYRQFKRAIVHIDGDCWEMNSTEVDLALQQIGGNIPCHQPTR